MTVQKFLLTIDGISTWVGKAAAWLIIVLMSVVCIEVFKRYILNMPTAWIFDLDNMLYGTLFMLCGAYTLAQNAHVRGDFLYSSMRPRTQAGLDLVLYIVFFLPGIAALIYAGYDYAALSWRIAEHSNVTANGPPVYHFKTIIPIAGALVMLQGVAEIVAPHRLPQDRRMAEPPEGRGRNRRHRGAARAQRIRRRRVAQDRDRARAGNRRDRAPARHGRGLEHMSDPALGLLMLALIVVVIMMGFPTAFTLMGLGMFFGFIAFYDPSHSWLDNRVFDLMVERTYGAMTNDVLISIPLFVLMGYVMERGALVDKMFYSIQLAFRRVPASLAVATLIVCTFWGIASGLVGAVVVLMGVIAFNPMLRAGYDVKLASGVITAGGTLGILIPPSVMIIVYAAVAGQSIVKLYAAAMFPGFFLSFLYLVYIVGWAMINPKIAPPLPEGPDPGAGAGSGCRNSRRPIRKICWSRWSGAALAGQGEADRGRRQAHRLRDAAREFRLRAGAVHHRRRLALYGLVVRRHPSAGRRRGRGHRRAAARHSRAGHRIAATPAEEGPAGFYYWFWGIAAVCALLQVRYYRKMDAERLEVVKLVTSSTMPLGILTVVVLAVILFGITTATKSAAVGAFGAFLLAIQAGTLDWKRTKEAVFLTAKTTAMVCWLFVGSALFSGRVRDPRRSGAARALGAVAQHVADHVHDPVAGDHLRARLAAGMDRDHHHLRADLPADAQALQHRPDPVGHAGVREPAGGVPVAAGGDVGVLSQGRRAEARHAQPDLRRHDALHADRDRLHGHHVSLARHDAVAAELSLRRLTEGSTVD